jgi:phosphoketolase
MQIHRDTSVQNQLLQATSDHVVNKKTDIVRVYLPPDANCLLSVFDHCLRSRSYVNVVESPTFHAKAVLLSAANQHW